jgi:hypothetical protein
MQRYSVAASNRGILNYTTGQPERKKVTIQVTGTWMAIPNQG